MPEGFYIGTGKITDAKGNLSSQTDVIIYDRRSIPYIFYGGEQLVVPIENVYYSIEVKSKLSAGELTDAVNKGVRLRSLFGGHFPHSALFAFETDLISSPESQRIAQAQKDQAPPLPINVFCVARQQYGFWDHKRGCWSWTEQEMANMVVLNFLVGILNTLVESAQKPRVALQPGWYFYPEVEMPTADRPV